ncbi:hypothetical protein XENTR_v10017365 [Xenopus tropicalis]|nr:hypothetical protein XENTR_v10017365 [Xenopus tropicalis]
MGDVLPIIQSFLDNGFLSNGSYSCIIVNLHCCSGDSTWHPHFHCTEPLLPVLTILMQFKCPQSEYNCESLLLNCFMDIGNHE